MPDGTGGVTVVVMEVAAKKVPPGAEKEKRLMFLLRMCVIFHKAFLYCHYSLLLSFSSIHRPPAFFLSPFSLAVSGVELLCFNKWSIQPASQCVGLVYSACLKHACAWTGGAEAPAVVAVAIAVEPTRAPSSSWIRVP